MLETLDLDKSIDKEAYSKSFPVLRDKLRALQRQTYDAKIPVAVVFEGWDAAGKGDTVGKLVERLDPRGVKVHPISAPLEEESLRPFLWRFWTKVPGRGEMAVFDRSWYGRVLVERVEGFAPEADWQRAYTEINDFEADMLRHGLVTVKFWLNISKAEQLRRFKEREQIGFKRFKITDEDWRNREKWDEYQHAVCDMVDRTSTEIAPWVLVEANDKNFARIKILKTLCQHIEAAMG